MLSVFEIDFERHIVDSRNREDEFQKFNIERRVKRHGSAVVSVIFAVGLEENLFRLLSVRKNRAGIRFIVELAQIDRPLRRSVYADSVRVHDDRVGHCGIVRRARIRVIPLLERYAAVGERRGLHRRFRRRDRLRCSRKERLALRGEFHFDRIVAAVGHVFHLERFRRAAALDLASALRPLIGDFGVAHARRRKIRGQRNALGSAVSVVDELVAVRGITRHARTRCGNINLRLIDFPHGIQFVVAEHIARNRLKRRFLSRLVCRPAHEDAVFGKRRLEQRFARLDDLRFEAVVHAILVVSARRIIIIGNGDFQRIPHGRFGDGITCRACYVRISHICVVNYAFIDPNFIGKTYVVYHCRPHIGTRSACGAVPARCRHAMRSEYVKRNCRCVILINVSQSIRILRVPVYIRSGNRTV